jgi:glycosyltransferase involved in cell wall biosynthesis
MSVVIVDWLGRGGIAQTTESWVLELQTSGTDVEVVTRPGRELGALPGIAPDRPAPSGRLVAHRDVAARAARRIRDLLPGVVVVQNYVAPPLERAVHAAARAVGARIVVVVHNHQVHTLRAGTRVGLRSQLQRADAVVAHTHFVADGIRAFASRDDIVVLPHPVPVGIVRGGREALSPSSDDRLVAATFGVLKRAYKGTSVFLRLAATGVDGWRFVAVGSGAPAAAPGVASVPGYVSPARLAAEVSASDAAIAPYLRATQSGVVMLGHALGSVPVATAVGGIPEQIDDGVDGLLLPPHAPVEAWRGSLERLADDDFRKSLAAAGERRAWREHEAFVRGVHEVTR